MSNMRLILRSPARPGASPVLGSLGSLGAPDRRLLISGIRVRRILGSRRASSANIAPFAASDRSVRSKALPLIISLQILCSGSHPLTRPPFTPPNPNTVAQHAMPTTVADGPPSAPKPARCLRNCTSVQGLLHRTREAVCQHQLGRVVYGPL